jgi:hypothetical protein
MAIRDRNIEWKRQKRVIPWNEFGVIGTAAATALSALGNTGTATAAATTAEVSTFKFAGLGITGLAGQDFATLDLQTPSLIDPTEEIGVRVLYTINVASPTATDSVTWLVKYDQVDPGEAFVVPGTALNTDIAAQLDGGTTGFLYRVSSRGIINANTIDHTAKTGCISWLVECDALTTYVADEIMFLGLEIDYKPLLCVNTEETVDVYKDIAATN